METSFLSPLNNDLTEALTTQGWYVSDSLVPREISLALLAQLKLHKNSQMLRKAGIGQGEKNQVATDVRGDYTRWLEPETPTEHEKAFLIWLENFKKLLNQKLFLGLQNYEAHYAFYPPSSGYKKHLDTFEGDTRRVISFVLYLNEVWEPAWGGELMLYNERNSEDLSVKILPEFSRLAVFLSEHIFHEVNFTKHARFSVTGWLKKPLAADVPGTF